MVCHFRARHENPTDDKNRTSVLPSTDWLGFALEDRGHAGSDAEQEARHCDLYSLNSSRRRLVCTRLTGISVCFLSSMRSW